MNPAAQTQWLSLTPRPRVSVLLLRSGDHTGIAVRALHPGDVVDLDGRTIRATETIDAGHKMALVAIPAGTAVRKYGQVIGIATADIDAGAHVHTHNLAFVDTDVKDSGAVHVAPTRSSLSATNSDACSKPPSFLGIIRPDGRVATRNYVGIVSTVNCSATVAKMIAARVEVSGVLAGHPEVDGVVAITHSGGCGMADDGEDLDLLRRTIGGYAAHSNIGALLIVGLGCEVNQTAGLLDTVALCPKIPVRTMTIQQVGGTAATVRAGVQAISELLAEMPATGRTEVPASNLVLGLKCGGSDGYSGITANPALGIAADLLIAAGGTAVLGETPEIYGAEHLLAARASQPRVAEALLQRIHWWRHYTELHGATLDNNPSPGNHQGGITTILEKSLGAVAKAGSTPLRGVRQFAEPIAGPGLIFMDTPGYDPVSVTGMVAGGANIVCFTTGRGSVFGSKPAPTLKLATNTSMYEHMRADMDLNCGTIVDGEQTVEQVGREIFQQILRTASGQPTRSEDLGMGQEEFVPWHRGAVL